MVGVAEGDHVEIPRISAGHQEREVVRLGAGVDKIADIEIAGEPGRQGSGVEGDVRVQVDRGRVLEGFVLAVRGGHDMRVTMPDAHGDDPAKTIEIPAAFFVEEVLSTAGHDHQRLPVIMVNRRVHELPPEPCHLLDRGS